ncbi:unnamed protein product, partial [Prorocentrum cordatum]
MACNPCNCSKGTHFAGSPEESVPSFKSKDSIKLAKAVEELKLLKAKMGDKKPQTAGAGAAADAANKQRLDVITAKLNSIQGLVGSPDVGEAELRESLEATRAKLEEEQVQLRATIFSSKPKGAQFKRISDQIKKVEKQVEKGRAEVAAIADQKRELGAEQARVVGMAPAPPGGPGADLDGLVVVGGVSITAGFLGRVLGGFHVDAAAQRAISEQALKLEQQRRGARAAVAEEAAAQAKARPRAQLASSW